MSCEETTIKVSEFVEIVVCSAICYYVAIYHKRDLFLNGSRYQPPILVLSCKEKFKIPVALQPDVKVGQWAN